MAEKIIFELVLDTTKLNARAKASAKALDGLVKEQTKLRKAGKQNTQGFQELSNEITRNRKVLRDSTKAIQEISRVREADSGSLQDLKAQLRVVTEARNSMSKADREGTERGRALTKTSKELTDKLKEQEGAVGQTGRNVGNYAEAIKKGEVKVDGLKDQLKLATVQLGKQRTAFNRNTKGNKKFADSVRNSEQRVDGLKDELKRANTELRNQKKALSNITSTLDKFKEKLKGLAGIVVGAFAFASVIRAGKAIVSLTEDIKKNRLEVQNLTGLTGRSLKSLTSRIEATGKTFDEDFNRILIATNSLSKQMGISLEESLDIIQKGFLSGADASGELLDILKEYPAQLDAVGLAADESVALISQQVKTGVYSDKGIDTIKEAGLRLREMTPATIEALEAIGLSSDEIEKSLTDGSKTLFDIIQEVSKQLSTLPPQSKIVGTAIADIFGGAGEDAGLKYITTLQDIDLELDNLIDGTNKMVSQQMQLLISNERLSKIFSDLFGNLVNALIPAFSTMVNILDKAVGKSESLTEEYENQSKAVSDLETNIVPLLESHDILASKTELSTEQQVELDNIIQQIAKHIPSAISELDKYGNVIGISTDAARRFNEQQKAILKIKFAEAIKENIDVIDDLVFRQKSLFRNLRLVNGEWFNHTVSISKTNKVTIDNTKADLLSVQKKLKLKAVLQEEIEVRKAIIAEILGEKSTKELAAEAEAEAAKKAAEAAKKAAEAAKKAAEAEAARIGTIGALNKQIAKLRKAQLDLIPGSQLLAENQAEILRIEILLGKEIKTNTKEIEKAKKRQAELEAKAFKLKALLADSEVALIEDKEARLEAIEALRFERLEASLIKEFGETEKTKILIEQLEIAHHQNLAKIADDAAKVNLDRDLKEIQRKKAQAAEDEKKAKDESDQKTANNQLAKETALNIAQEVSDALFANANENRAREFAADLTVVNQKADTAKLVLDNQLASGLLSQEEFNTKSKLLDDKRAIQETQLRREAFNEQKKADELQALVNGALAIVKAIALFGPPPSPAGIAAIAAAVATTAIQIGVIKSKKFKKGGISSQHIVEGKDHSQGGTTYVGEDGHSFTAERGELITIVNKKSTATIGRLSKLNQKNGNGIAFGRGGVPKRTFGNLSFQDGGFANRQVNQANDQTEILAEALADKIADITIVTDIEDIVDAALRRDRIRNRIRI